LFVKRSKKFREHFIKEGIKFDVIYKRQRYIGEENLHFVLLYKSNFKRLAV